MKTKLRRRNNMNFTPEQKQALINRKSNILLSAGAGSGKTAVLTEKVYRLIKEGIDPSRLLVDRKSTRLNSSHL